MPQIFLPPDLIAGSTFTLLGSEARHLIRVLRKKPGDKIPMFNGKGETFIGQIQHINRKQDRVTGQIVASDSKLPSSVLIHLFQGLPKGSKFDYVIEKATELGVDAIIPFTSRKNPVSIPDDKIADRVHRWDRVAKAAAKQCDREVLPVIEAPQPLEAFESRLKGSQTIVFDKTNENVSYRDVIKGLHLEGGVINLVIGPESGFEQGEVDRLRQAGAKIAGLGGLTLRTETAGLVAISILKYELQLI